MSESRNVAQHELKRENDVGYEYTQKILEKLSEKSPKPSVNTKHRLMQLNIFHHVYLTPHSLHQISTMHLLNALDVMQIRVTSCICFGRTHTCIIIGVKFANLHEKYYRKLSHQILEYQY